MEPEPTLGALLVTHRAVLRRWLERKAGVRLLRYEGLDDLLQGVQCRALTLAESFRYQGEAPFFAWLFRVAEHFLYDRSRYWSAQRRDTTRVIRLLEVESGGWDVPASITSPSSSAARRELIEAVTRAVASLPARDQELIALAARGASGEEIAARLGLLPRSATQARRRAIERLTKVVRLMNRHWLPRRPPEENP